MVCLVQNVNRQQSKIVIYMKKIRKSPVTGDFFCFAKTDLALIKY